MDDTEAAAMEEEAAKAKAKAEALEKGEDGALDLEQADKESRSSK